MNVGHLLAGKILGGNINWEEVGKDSFLVEVSITRDCNGIQVGSSAVTFTSTCGVQRLNTISSVVSDITPVCQSQCSRCDKSTCKFGMGIQKLSFKTLFVATNFRKNGCCKVKIGFQSGRRGNGITTGAQANGFYLEAEMNLCKPVDLRWLPGNSLISGVYSDFISNVGLQNINKGDSVVYSLTEPRQSLTSKANFKSPYSYKNPVWYSGFPYESLPFPRGFHLDAQNGMLMFRPMRAEGAVIVIKAEVFRQGTKIAESVNDFVLFIDSSRANNVPVLSGQECKAPKSSNFKLNVCAGQELCFQVCTSDKDKDDTVKLKLLDSIPGSRFSIVNKGDRRERAIFCWTPDSSHARAQPYRFVVEAYDDACPIIGQTRRVYEINVKPYHKVKLATMDQGCGKVEYLATNIDSTLISQALWHLDGDVVKVINGFRTQDTLVNSFITPGLKRVKFLYITTWGCTFEITDSTTLKDDFIQLKLSEDTVVCEGSDVQLKAATSNAQGPVSMKWSTGATFNTVNSQISLYDLKDDSLLSINYSDGQCSKVQEVQLTVNHLNFTNLRAVYGYCVNDTSLVGIKRLVVDSNDSDTLLKHEWFDPSMKHVHTGDTFKVADSGLYFLRTTDSLGCVTWDTTKIMEHPRVVAPILNDGGFCGKQSDTLTFRRVLNLDLGTLQGYNAVNDSQFIGNFRSTPREKLMLTDTITNCRDSAFYAIHYHNLEHKVKMLSKACFYDSLKIESNLPNGTWQLNNMTQFHKSSISFVPSDLINSYQVSLRYDVVDSNTCRHDFDTLISVSKHPSASRSVPDTVIINQTFYLKASPDDTAFFSYKWTIGQPAWKTYTSATPAVVLDSLGHFPVELIIVNKNTGCSNVSGKIHYVRVVNSTTYSSFSKPSYQTYPNPFSDKLSVQFANDHVERIQLVNSVGQIVFESSVIGQGFEISTSHLPKGSYILTIRTSQGLSALKLIKADW